MFNSHNSIPNLSNQNIFIINYLDKAKINFCTLLRQLLQMTIISQVNFLLEHIFFTQIIPNYTIVNGSKHLKHINSVSAAGPDALPGKFWHYSHSLLVLFLSIIII